MRNMNDRETLDLHLNVLQDFDPVLPESYRRCRLLFLANGSPAHQLKTLDQCPEASLVVADTMDHYIRTELDGLRQLLKRIDGLVLNDSEAELVTGDDNLVRAGHAIRAMGPKFVVIKKGEHGAMFFGQDEIYVLPAYPTATVVDPTGAGDSFAGGMMGYLAEQAAKRGLSQFSSAKMGLSPWIGRAVPAGTDRRLVGDCPLFARSENAEIGPGLWHPDGQLCHRRLQPRPPAADRTPGSRPPHGGISANVEFLTEK